MITKKQLSELSFKIIGAAIEVHRELGPGLLESVYLKCLKRVLELRGVKCTTQLQVPVSYKGEDLDVELRLDLLVEDMIVVELKAVDTMIPVFEAQLLTYMKLLKKPKGLLINFNSVVLSQDGLKSMVNQLYTELPDF